MPLAPRPWPALPPPGGEALRAAARLDDAAADVRARAAACHRLAADPGLVGPAGDALRALLADLAEDTRAAGAAVAALARSLRSAA